MVTTMSKNRSNPKDSFGQVLNQFAAHDEGDDDNVYDQYGNPMPRSSSPTHSNPVSDSSSGPHSRSSSPLPSVSADSSPLDMDDEDEPSYLLFKDRIEDYLKGDKSLDQATLNFLRSYIGSSEEDAGSNIVYGAYSKYLRENVDPKKIKPIYVDEASKDYNKIVDPVSCAVGAAAIISIATSAIYAPQFAQFIDATKGPLSETGMIILLTITIALLAVLLTKAVGDSIAKHITANEFDKDQETLSMIPQ